MGRPSNFLTALEVLTCQFQQSTPSNRKYRAYDIHSYTTRKIIEKQVSLKEYGNMGISLPPSLPFEGGREGREGGMTVIHILICMFNSNPMIPQYLNNNLT